MDERLHDCVNYITPLRFFFHSLFSAGSVTAELQQKTPSYLLP